MRRVARLTAEGYLNAEIARLVGTSEQVIKNVQQRIYDETGMCSKLELALWWRSKGSGFDAETEDCTL